MTDITQTNGDLVTLDRLLSELSRRLDGAIDIWTAICLEQPSSDSCSFLANNREIIHSLIVVIKAVLGGKASTQDIYPVLARMRSDSLKLDGAFSALANFRLHSQPEIREAVADLSSAYRALQDAIGQLGSKLSVSISYLGTKTAENETYFQRILDGLADSLEQELARGHAIAPLPAAK